MFNSHDFFVASPGWCQKFGAAVYPGTIKRGFCLLLSCCLFGCGGAEYVTLQGPTMGTYYAVQYGPQTQCDVTGEDINAVLADVNGKMSTYLPDSELSLINAAPPNIAHSLSADLNHVLSAAALLWQRSAGAFDVTVGPLVNLWGFGPDTQQAVPTAAQQQAAQAKVGMDKLRLQQGVLTLPVAGMYIDLSALAKGFAVDEVADLLRKADCRNFMVDIGGEIRVQGVSARGTPWRVGIEVPDPGKVGTLQTILTLSDVSIATSGDYRNFRMVQGQRVDHILDPRTGQPARNAVVSATVVHDSAMWADAYATTLMTLGLEEGINFAQREGIAAYIMVGQQVTAAEDTADARFESRYTDEMKKYLPPETLEGGGVSKAQQQDSTIENR